MPAVLCRRKITDWPGPKDQSGDDVPTPEVGYVAKTEGTRIIRNYAQVRTDHAFAANLALWDSYYFSGLNMQANSYSLPGDKRALAQAKFHDIVRAACGYAGFVTDPADIPRIIGR